MLIVAALPDPVGTDRVHELVTLLNTTAAAIDLTGWRLVDAAGGRQNLSGTVAAGAVVQVTAQGALQLGNQGDTIIPVDGSGGSIGTVALSDHPVRLPPLRRSKTTDHGHGRVVRPFLGALP